MTSEFQIFHDLAGHQRSESALRAAGFALPLAHRAAWAEGCAAGPTAFVELRSADQQLQGGFAVEFTPTRAMPGHVILRCERFGEGLAPDACDTALRAISQLARDHQRVLSIHIETYARDSALRARLGDSLARAGFQNYADARRYSTTLTLDLAGDEAAIFSRLASKARRDVRAVAKFPVVLRPVTDVALIPRIEELRAQTMQRTGGICRKFNWEAFLQLVVAHPHLAALPGLFRTDIAGPEALIAFSIGHHNGAYAHYEIAASTRCEELKKLPLNYAPLWELIRWAKLHNAATFDLGGITPGTAHDPTDALGGISDFKRYFAQNQIDVGGEWAIEPHWLRARIANTMTAAASWASSLKRKRPTPSQPTPH